MRPLSPVFFLPSLDSAGYSRAFLPEEAEAFVGFLDRGVLSTPLELRLCLAIPEASGKGAETATQRAPATGLFADAE